MISPSYPSRVFAGVDRPLLIQALVTLAIGLAVALLLPGLLLGQLSLVLTGLLLFATAAVLVLSMITMSHHYDTGFLNPALILPAYLSLLYVMRPIVILISGVVGTPQSGISPLVYLRPQFDSTLVITSVATIAFAVAYMCAPRLTILSYLKTSRVMHAYFPQRFLIIGALSFLAGAYVFSQLRSYPGGWQAALTVRQVFFAGRGYLSWIMILYKFAFLIWLSCVLKDGGWQGSKQRLLLAIGLLWFPSLFFDGLAGSRAALILENLVPTFVVWRASIPHARIGLRATIMIVVLSVAVFVAYRSFVRDKFANEPNTSPVAIVLKNTLTLPTVILSEDEASAFDYLLVTRDRVPSQLEFRGLDDVSSILFALAPSSLVPGKPQRSGAILTKYLLPDTYRNGGNVAFSGAGDLYYMAGDVAVVAGFALVGLLSGMVIKSLGALSIGNPNRALVLAMSFIVTSDFLSVLRSDLFQSTAIVAKLVLLLLMITFLTDTPRGEARHPGTRLSRTEAP